MGGIILLPLIALADPLLNKGDSKNYFTRWKDKKLWIAGLFCGIPLFVAMNLQQMGMVHTDAGKAGFLTAMYIVFVPILGIFRGQKPTRWIPLSVLLGVVGLYLLSCVGVTQISGGDLLLIACALVFAVQILCVDKFAGAVDCLRLNCINAFLCSALSWIAVLFTESPTWEGIISCSGSLAYAGVLSTGIAYSLQNLGQKDLPPATASLLMSMESVFAVLSGWLVLKERLNQWEALGCVLVFIAVILSQLPDKKKEKTSV
jgi:drug/metabolite transporter (DMT)-like permease